MDVVLDFVYPASDVADAPQLASPQRPAEAAPAS